MGFSGLSNAKSKAKSAKGKKTNKTKQKNEARDLLQEDEECSVLWRLLSVCVCVCVCVDSPAV